MTEKKERTITKRVWVFTCDQCGVIFETEHEEMFKALKQAEKRGWTKKPGEGDWQNHCPRCSVQMKKKERDDFMRAKGEGPNIYRGGKG
jgi:hypothetical protein